MAVKTASRTAKRVDYKELRACIECTLREHLMMDKEVHVLYHEYETWMGHARKVIFKSKKAGEDIIRSSDKKASISTNGYFSSDLPPLPKDPIKMIKRVAEKMGLKVIVPSKAKKEKELVIKK